MSVQEENLKGDGHVLFPNSGSAIVWYAVNLNYIFSSVFYVGPQRQISRTTGGPRIIVWETLVYTNPCQEFKGLLSNIVKILMYWNQLL